MWSYFVYNLHFYLVKSQSHTVLWALLCNLPVPFKPTLGCSKSFFNRIKVWGIRARKIERYQSFIYCKIFYQHVEIHTNYSQWTLAWITATHHYILQGEPITQLGWQKLVLSFHWWNQYNTYQSRHLTNPNAYLTKRVEEKKEHSAEKHGWTWAQC